MLVSIYYFDNDSYFVNEGKAQQVKSGAVLMPDNATATAPDADLLKTHFAKWNQELKTWDYEAKPTQASDFEGIHVSHKSQSPRDIELRSLIQKLTKDNSSYRLIRGSEEEGLWWGVEKIPEKTQDEKDLESAKVEEQKALAYLRSTDYVAVKLAEGVATAEEYSEVLQKRAETRKLINSLRAQQQVLQAKVEAS